MPDFRNALIREPVIAFTPLPTTWTPEKKREYARQRYRKLKAQGSSTLQAKRLESEEKPKPENSDAREDLRRMAKWLLLESKKSG
jgi:hypothetical protein